MPFLCQYCKKFTSGIYKKTAKGHGILTPHTAPLQSFPYFVFSLAYFFSIDQHESFHTVKMSEAFRFQRYRSRKVSPYWHFQGLLPMLPLYPRMSDMCILSQWHFDGSGNHLALVTALCRCIDNKVDFIRQGSDPAHLVSLQKSS